jgi:hypothetical protein
MLLFLVPLERHSTCRLLGVFASRYPGTKVRSNFRNNRRQDNKRKARSRKQRSITIAESRDSGSRPTLFAYVPIGTKRTTLAQILSGNRLQSLRCSVQGNIDIAG